MPAAVHEPEGAPGRSPSTEIPYQILPGPYGRPSHFMTVRRSIIMLSRLLQESVVHNRYISQRQSTA